MKYLILALLLPVFAQARPLDAHSSLDRWVTIPEVAPLGYYNDYTEARYDEVLDRFIRIMQPRVGARGGELKILRDWTDGAVNAWAWREGSEYWIEIPGGAARYNIINEEAFIATLCHELGHLMGGAPRNLDISYEGQGDYYSGAKCLRIVLREIEPWKVLAPSPETVRACEIWPDRRDREICQRSLTGALALTEYYAQIEHNPAPKISTPSQERVSETMRAHPKAQCRLDTYVAGALCPISSSVDFGIYDARTGACHSQSAAAYARPACWFKEN